MERGVITTTKAQITMTRKEAENVVASYDSLEDDYYGVFFKAKYLELRQLIYQIRIGYCESQQKSANGKWVKENVGTNN